jgi:hypothetical protein
MKTVPISARSKKINALLKRARRENIFLRAKDGAEFILAEIHDFNREIELTRQNKKLMKFLETRAKQDRTIPLAKVRAELGF